MPTDASDSATNAATGSATPTAPGSMTLGVAGRYADALFDLARETGVLEVVEGDFRNLQNAIDSSDELCRFLKSPVYGAEEKGAAIAAIADKGGLSGVSKNFLGLVAQNRRLFALDGIIAAFFARLAEHRGEVTAEAISAAPLNDEQTKKLRGEIERYVGKAVNLFTKVDPDLLGGLVVKVGSVMVDSSLRSKLNRLKTTLKEA
ncbi:MAG: F0F1 ATP synthase subunit delta [Parvularculaceae bacterium]|nr:MAG: F0F1 ATP synthase subunit delta [Parvularculaceae bacterium]